MSSLQTHQGTWEDPDDGSDSEYGEEEDEQMEENDLDFESDWEEEKAAATTASVAKSTEINYEEDLLKGCYPLNYFTDFSYGKRLSIQVTFLIFYHCVGTY